MSEVDARWTGGHPSTSPCVAKDVHSGTGINYKKRDITTFLRYARQGVVDACPPCPPVHHVHLASTEGKAA